MVPLEMASIPSAAASARFFLRPPPSLQQLFLSSFAQHRRRQSLRVRASNAARAHQDDKSQLNQISDVQSTKLRIAIIGFGNFGQFLAKTFIRQGHTVYAHSRSDYQSIAESMGAVYFSDAHDLCESQPDVMLMSTSILSMKDVLRSLPLRRLRRNTLFVDVFSVKEHPMKLFLQELPAHFDILCTHPLFGPESGKNGWQNLDFMFHKVRIGGDGKRVDDFLDIFKKEGCRMVEMSCSEHDRYAGGSQFITHLVGRVLEKFGPEDTPIKTRGYEALLDLKENTCRDSFDLFFGLFLHNRENSTKQLGRFESAFMEVKRDLFRRSTSEQDDGGGNSSRVDGSEF